MVAKAVSSSNPYCWGGSHGGRYNTYGDELLIIVVGMIVVVGGVLLAVSPKLLENSGQVGLFLSQLKWHIWALPVGACFAGGGLALILANLL